MKTHRFSRVHAGLRRVGIALLLAWLVALGHLPDAVAAPPAAEEYAVKAAYLYNFAKFVEWPARAFSGADAPLTLCIAGRDPFGDALDGVQGSTVRERPVAIRRLARLDEAAPCHLLFVSDSESARVPLFLSRLHNSPVLTVSDIQGFATAGGMIGLVSVGQRVRFEINLNAVQRADLKISSQLLKLATIIGGAE